MAVTQGPRVRPPRKKYSELRFARLAKAKPIPKTTAIYIHMAIRICIVLSIFSPPTVLSCMMAHDIYQQFKQLK